MTDTTFVNQSTVIEAPWMQDVNNLVYRIRTFELQQYGAVCNGVADDTAAVLSAIASLGTGNFRLIIPGPTLISSNVTFGAGTVVQFSPGAYIKGQAGTEIVTVQQQVEAARAQCFSHCIAASTVGQTTFPEWFGALRNGTSDDSSAINACYTFLNNVGGVISLAPGNYGLARAIVASVHRVSLVGAGLETTTLTMLLNGHDGIDCTGAQGNPINTPVFSGFSLNASPQSTSGAGINLTYTALGKLQDIQVNGFINGYNQVGATNTFFTRCGASYAGTVSNFIGFNINGSGNVGGNASSVYRDCYVQGSGTSGTACIAFRAYGTYVSDLYFDNCASAECNYGFELDYTTATAGGYADIELVNPVVDGYSQQGILVVSLPSEQKLTIVGGWLNSLYTGIESDGIYLNSCIGQVSITGVQIQGEGNAANVEAIRIINSIQVTVSNCMFSNCVRAIYETGSQQCLYQGNQISNSQLNAANMMYLVGTLGAVIQGNSFVGNANSIVFVDNTSASAAVIGNTMALATAASRISNNATLPVGGANGSTGLNIGY